MRSVSFSLLALILIFVAGVSQSQPESARIYVRRIEFQGVDGIADDVLRRELIQLEGTFLNTLAMEQSRLQLERLPYIAEAQVSLRPIAGAINQVDVLIAVTQAPARYYGGGGGYSESQHVSIRGFFTHENLFGTGQWFSVNASASEFRSLVELSHTDPFTRQARISRTVTLASRQIDRLTADTTKFDADSLSARLEFGYRTGEYQAISLGVAFDSVDLATGPSVSEQWLDWVQRNGNPALPGATPATDFLAADFLMRWRQDTRERVVFPERGVEQSLTLRLALPRSDVEYFTLDYSLTKHWPLAGKWEARLDTRLGYGAKYGSSTSSLPPYLNWFAGGPNSVRGFDDGRLGPRDSLGNPFGGNLFVSSQYELMLPLPDNWRERVRLGVFYDIGGVFATADVDFRDSSGMSLDYGFRSSRLRRSAGLAARILMPIGIVRLSYGVPLNAADDHPNAFLRDDTDRFQIAIDVNF